MSIVIVGAGHAGVHVATELRAAGHTGGIVLLSAEADAPYQRPPLSKTFLKDVGDGRGLPLKSEGYFAEHGIDLRLGVRVTAIERRDRQVRLGDGTALGYEHLVLATGSRPRPLALPGRDLDGVVTLASIADARGIAARLPEIVSVVVIGGGFVGLELAATLASLGKAVTVIEAAGRPMARAVSPAVSRFFVRAQADLGVPVLVDSAVAAIEGEDGRVREVRLADGARLGADLVVVAVGVVADDRLARAAGLAVADGVLVDATLLSDDPAISAVGDCARFPDGAGGTRRLESIQNAVDQAKVTAIRLTGGTAVYEALPWFWSDQGPWKLQIAGLADRCDAFLAEEDRAGAGLIVYGFRHGVLGAVETVNLPAVHLAARRLLGAGARLTAEEVGAPGFSLRARLGR
jgi:3-phenylpropionate/trans-cinnamate dioxygenase ferredoxin reductase subunit